MNSKENPKKIYRFLLSKRNYISFIIGSILSAYIVQISVSPSNNIFHWIVVFCGIIIGALLYILLCISENYEDNLKTIKKNTPNKSAEDIHNESWKSINQKGIKANLILKILPKFWVPFSLILIPPMFVGGIMLLHFGNAKNKQENIVIQNEIQTFLINQVDSLNTVRIDSLEMKIDHLNNTQKYNYINLKIDSLRMQINDLTKQLTKKKQN